MDLVAISPVTRTVALGSAAVEVTGLSFRKLVHLVMDYPELVPLVAGGRADLGKILIEAPEIAIAAFMLGLVGPARRRFWRWRGNETAIVSDNAQWIKAFDNAPAGQQIDALATIYDLTFKGERAIPFLKMAVAALASAASPESIPPEPSPAPSSS